MPCLRHLGLHLCQKRCTDALQGRCTYSAHTRPDAIVLFKSIRSDGIWEGAVWSLFRSAVRTAPLCFPRGQSCGAVQALFRGDVLFFIFPGEALYRSLYVQRPRHIFSHLSKRNILLLTPYIYASITLGHKREFIIRFHTQDIFQEKKNS